MRSLAVVFALSACTVQSVDFNGRRCPCSEGWVCDESERCCLPAVTGEDFHAAWTTEQSIRFAWDPIGEAGDLLEYQIVIGTSEEELIARTRVVDRTTNPELGGFVLPQTRGVADVVRNTIVRDLAPGTRYFARLEALDANGCTFQSPIVIADTMPRLTRELVLYAEDAVGNRNPPNFEPVPDPEGGQHLEYMTVTDGECSPDEPVCGNNLRRTEFAAQIIDLERGSFASEERTAIVEMTVQHDSPVPSYYSKVWLRFTDGAGECGVDFRLEPFTIPGGAPILIQVPLAELRSGDGEARAPRHEELTSVCEFCVGGAWDRGSTVWVDDVVLRW